MRKVLRETSNNYSSCDRWTNWWKNTSRDGLAYWFNEAHLLSVWNPNWIIKSNEILRLLPVWIITCGTCWWLGRPSERRHRRRCQTAFPWSTCSATIGQRWGGSPRGNSASSWEIMPTLDEVNRAGWKFLPERVRGYFRFWLPESGRQVSRDKHGVVIDKDEILVTWWKSVRKFKWIQVNKIASTSSWILQGSFSFWKGTFEGYIFLWDHICQRFLKIIIDFVAYLLTFCWINYVPQATT